jgi:uncharacterized protein
MIIDCHTHIFPPEIRQDRKPFLQSDPAFACLYRAENARLAGATALVETMDRQGVDRAVAFGFPWSDLEITRCHNDYVMASVARFGGRLIGLGCVDPSTTGAIDELERCLNGGLSGVGELAFYQSDLDDRVLACLDPVMALCRERSVPVVLHTNEPVGHVYPGKAPMTLHRLYRLLQRFPFNQIVLAHWGGGLFWYGLLKKEVAEVLSNVWFDTAASPFLYRPDVYRSAVTLAGSGRILFGSDFPLIEPKRYFAEMKATGLPEPVIERICGDNAAELFQLERT